MLARVYGLQSEIVQNYRISSRKVTNFVSDMSVPIRELG